MKISQEQFDTAQKSFNQRALSVEQKEKMLSAIYTSESIINTSTPSSILSPYTKYLFSKVCVSALAILILFSGTTYASMQSLPGDLLYGPKVNVIEPLELLLKVDPVAQREYNISLLEKRVAEMEKLKEKNRLDEKSQRESYVATKTKVADIEKDSSIDDEIKMKISDRLNVYNSLISLDTKIESVLLVKVVTETKSEENETNSTIPQKESVRVSVPAVVNTDTVAGIHVPTTTQIASTTLLKDIVDEVTGKIVDKKVEEKNLDENTVKEDEQNDDALDLPVKLPVKVEVEIDTEPVKDFLGL